MVALALVCGMASAMVFTVVVLLSWRITPEVWLADVTDGEQRTALNATNVTWFVLVAVSFVGGGFVAAWLAAARHDATFVQATLVAFIAMLTVNLVDLLVVDIVVYLWIRPSWMTIPGLEMPTGYGIHVRGALNGVLLAVPISLVAAAVSLAA